MELSGKLIKDKNIIYGGREENYQPSSYDLTLAYTEEILTEKSTNCEIPPHTSVLATTVEEVQMPIDVSAMIKPKSSFSRQGMLVGEGYVDPGFRGTLTVLLYNTTDHSLFLKSGRPFCQLVFNFVAENDTAYDGHYQDQQGIGRSVKVE